MQSKICGLSTPEQVEACVEYKAKFCGFQTMLNDNQFKTLLG